MVDKNCKLKVALFGPYPPPYGGVSIHIQRLQNYLLNKNIECIVYDITQFLTSTKELISSSTLKNWPWIFNCSNSVVHIHNSGANLKKIILLSILLKMRGNKIIVTYHSLRDNVEQFNWFKKKILQLNLRFISHCVVVSPHIREKFLKLGTNSEKITVIPAFLPPTIIQQDIENIPKEIWDFIDSHNPVISANAFKIRFYDNQDLYGIDMCIDLCANLKDDYPQIGLVFCLPDIGDQNYFKKMKERIVEKSIGSNFLFVNAPYQFYPILMRSDLFVRPTITDGDAVSIREALYLKIPTVSSNVVPRPEGTILFKNQDNNEFTSKVKDILNNWELHKKKLKSINIEDHIEKIVDIYQKLAKDKEV